MSATKTVIDELVAKAEEAAGVDRSGEVNFDISPVDAIVSPSSIYDPAVKAMYDAEPKRRVFIPTPDSWKESYPYAERVQINGIVYIIMSDQDVLVPESVAGVLDNQRAMNREVNRQVSAIRRLMQYTDISQVPHWYR